MVCTWLCISEDTLRLEAEFTKWMLVGTTMNPERHKALGLQRQQVYSKEGRKAAAAAAAADAAKRAAAAAAAAAAASPAASAPAAA